MNPLICYTIYIAVMYTTNAKAYEKENDHLCEETVKILTDDGQTYHDKIFVCCPGYIIDTSGKCIPLCERPCIYGYCKAPSVCECMDGYKMRKNECFPICEKKCVNGYCSKPGECGCIKGFELDDKNMTSCIPVCKPKCKKFSKCTKSIETGANECQCLNGYTENKKIKTCEPKCTKRCVNGFCIAPETCGCFNGFELDNANNTNCIPKCEPRCQSHSSCIAPNTCHCNDGYKFNDIVKKCEPICQDQVKNSRCIKPPNTWICNQNYQHDRRIDKCVLESCLCNDNGYCVENKEKCECYEGFTKNATTGQCESKCHPNCVNSICVANNVCQCLEGYHKIHHHYHICESNDLCNNRPCKNGECLITGECKCKSGYVKSLSYNGQLQCDKVQTFIGKVMTTILGVPMLLVSCVLLASYVIDKKKSYNVGDQEMMLIERR